MLQHHRNDLTDSNTKETLNEKTKRMYILLDVNADHF